MRGRQRLPSGPHPAPGLGHCGTPRTVAPLHSPGQCRRPVGSATGGSPRSSGACSATAPTPVVSGPTRPVPREGVNTAGSGDGGGGEDPIWKTCTFGIFGPLPTGRRHLSRAAPPRAQQPGRQGQRRPFRRRAPPRKPPREETDRNRHCLPGRHPHPPDHPTATARSARPEPTRRPWAGTYPEAPSTPPSPTGATAAAARNTDWAAAREVVPGICANRRVSTNAASSARAPNS